MMLPPATGARQIKEIVHAASEPADKTRLKPMQLALPLLFLPFAEQRTQHRIVRPDDR
jgi:hypothetical protein